MANHSSACVHSANLCKQLFEGLNQKIPNLEYEQQRNKCKIGAKAARKVFAWVNNHGIRAGKIEIWFLGPLEELQKYNELSVIPRKPTTGSWGEYEGRFEIATESQLKQAVELLAEISYPVSIR